MTKIILMKQADHLMYINQPGKDALDKIPEGDRVAIKIMSADQRTIEHHRWFFALMDMLYKNVDHEYATFDNFRVAIAAALGWGETVKIKGKEVWVPESFEIDRMKADRFKQCTEQLKDFIRNTIWKIADKELREILVQHMAEEGI
jgi:hypothetical protein